MHCVVDQTEEHAVYRDSNFGIPFNNCAAIRLYADR